MTGAYLDHAASSPLRPEARAAIDAVLEAPVGNPSGQHAWARAARRRLDDARDQVADLVGVAPGEVVWTSGGTEADDLAITGVLGALGGRAACPAVEHHAVLRPVQRADGVVLPVDEAGRPALDALDELLARDPSIRVVSVALANNEVGTVVDLASVAEVVHRPRPGRERPLLHTDAVAAAPWIDLRPIAEVADLLSISGHKLGGLPGSGVLVVRDPTPLRAVLPGGGQERERRGGTPNLAGAVGLAAALAACTSAQAADAARVAELRDRLLRGVLGRVGAGVRATVDPAAIVVLPGIAHLSVADVPAEALLFLLDERGVAASAGSSCASGAARPSHVVEAMGVADPWRRGSLRCSLGWSTTEAEIDLAIEVIASTILELRRAAVAGARP